ncbi:hypothetical protein [Chromobacterium haemolyticum]|uniref:hypothetical protein n=1 Tax=Chromobacterium haemolyticum TaxID=394935 RepID=UPI0009DA57C7|nr:hypothetical protein [Chromobacterium haemolyticum]OQS40592.1 hypothetical protein B0T39_11240 [Chromobacterium haemolyticum]
MTELEKQLLEALKELRDAYQEFMGLPAVKANAAIAAAARLADKVAQPESSAALTVWYGSMPESNGKANWTAILHRKDGCLSEGFTLERSEYPGRVRYEADRVRYLIGELEIEPSILDYDGSQHSGYVNHQPAIAQLAAVPEEWREFIECVSKQEPEKPDYWSSCGQCARNIDRAEDLIAAAPVPAQVEQRAPGSPGKRAWFRQASEFGPWIECAHDHPDAVLFQEAGATPATGKDSLQVQDEPPVPGSGRGVMFIDFLSAQAAKAGHKELAAELQAAIRAAGETGIQGLPAPGEPACHIAEASDEEVAIACTPAQRLLLREGMQLYAAPVAGGAIQVRKLGIFGKVYDDPQEKRAYTYADQPHNVAAWRLGRAAANVSAGGDHIDRGLSLLASLQAEGFGVFEMADDSLAAGPQEGGEA